MTWIDAWIAWIMSGLVGITCVLGWNAVEQGVLTVVQGRAALSAAEEAAEYVTGGGPVPSELIESGRICDISVSTDAETGCTTVESTCGVVEVHLWVPTS